MALDTKTAKAVAQQDAYNFPGIDAENVPYSLGLPWPKGLKSKAPDSKTPAVPPMVPTIAPPEFNHRETKEPREPVVPLPNYLVVSEKGLNKGEIAAMKESYAKKMKEAARQSSALTVSSMPKLDPGTHHRYKRFGEAYEAPVPKDTDRWIPKRQIQPCARKPRESKIKKKIVSALGDSTPRSWKPTSRARAKVVSTLERTADRIDRMAHGGMKRIVFAWKISGDSAHKATAAAGKALRHPISSAHSRIAKINRRKRPISEERHTFRDRTGGHQRLVLHRGIAPGEVEHMIRGHDWTKHFDCVLSLSQYSWTTGNKVTAALYFKNLPARLKQGVPWSRGSLIERVGEEIYYEVTCECCEGRPWVARTKWHERSPNPRFAAVITVGHLTRFEALNRNPFDVMKNATTKHAEMDFRTGPGRFRKVMWYRYKNRYGNDLCDNNWKNKFYQKWEEPFVADFVEFFGPLFQC